MKILRGILSIVVIVFAVFMLVTNNYEFMSYLMLAVGVSILITGIVELQGDKKSFWGYISIIVSLFLFFIFIQELFLH